MIFFYFYFVIMFFCDVKFIRREFEKNIYLIVKFFWNNNLEIDRNISIFLNLIVDVFKKDNKQFDVFLLRKKVVYDDVYKSHVRRRQTFFRAKIFRRSFNLFDWFNFRNSNITFFYFRSDFHFNFFYSSRLKMTIILAFNW